MRVLGIVWVWLALSLMACAPPGKGLYELNSPRHLSTGFDDDVLYEAVMTMVKTRGWRVRLANANHRWIEAQEPDVTDFGFVSRQRWVFRITHGTVSAQMFLDFKEDGGWKTYPVVYDGYSYAREFAVLESIEMTAHETIAAAR